MKIYNFGLLQALEIRIINIEPKYKVRKMLNLLKSPVKYLFSGGPSNFL